MSEVDRLSNSGLYPALPISDRQSSREDKERRPRSDPSADKGAPPTPPVPASPQPRPPKSLIDDYA